MPRNRPGRSNFASLSRRSHRSQYPVFKVRRAAISRARNHYTHVGASRRRESAAPRLLHTCAPGDRRPTDACATRNPRAGRADAAGRAGIKLGLAHVDARFGTATSMCLGQGGGRPGIALGTGGPSACTCHPSGSAADATTVAPRGRGPRRPRGGGRSGPRDPCGTRRPAGPGPSPACALAADCLPRAGGRAPERGVGHERADLHGRPPPGCAAGRVTASLQGSSRHRPSVPPRHPRCRRPAASAAGSRGPRHGRRGRAQPEGAAGRGGSPRRPPRTRRGPAPCGAGPRLCSAEMRVVGQRRPALPRAYPAVPSALGGLTSGFGMGPGVPPLPWSLTGDGHSCHQGRALRAAQRD